MAGARLMRRHTAEPGRVGRRREVKGEQSLGGPQRSRGKQGWGEEGFGVKWETGWVGPLGLDHGAAAGRGASCGRQSREELQGAWMWA